jgi:hypothetical protein
MDIDIPTSAIGRHQQAFALQGEISVIGVFTFLLWIAIGLRIWVARRHPGNVDHDHRSNKWNRMATVCIILTGVLATFYLIFKATLIGYDVRQESIALIKNSEGWFIRNPEHYSSAQKQETISLIRHESVVCLLRDLDIKTV